MCTLLTQNICLMCHTQWLDLGGNNIGDAGLTALAKAVESGALASLEVLFLENNQISDAGLSALAEAVGKGALPALGSLLLSGNPASEQAQQAAMDAIKNR